MVEKPPSKQKGNETVGTMGGRKDAGVEAGGGTENITGKASKAATDTGNGELKLVNRLAESKSPYVRGHMNNPVAWQIWNQDTLWLAKDCNRLIFLSIGYAACHWCHVMERESFENVEVARILNSTFIPIKVDREERPDVDRIYMNYVQATTGSGGWPLNVFLTPDLEPIFGGTYWPGPRTGKSAATPGNGVTFVDILHKIADVWHHDRQRCLDSAKEITAQLKQYAQEGTASELADRDGDGLELELLEEAYEHFRRKYDSKYGGFALAPKFPTPVNLDFLLKLGEYPNAVKGVVGEKECENAKNMALTTLRAMYRGGIHDHVGTGFHRYSVTREWSLPHFEKMLYDQGQLLHTYLTAFMITKDQEMLDAVHDLASYLITPPMQAPSGGFFSSEDADSYYRTEDTEKREGAFYVWTLKEIRTVLGDNEGEIFARYFNASENGNVSSENDPHDEFISQNVLSISATSIDMLARQCGLTTIQLSEMIENGKRKLRQHRDDTRPRPALDDKVVVGWNGIAIGALARTSIVLERTDAEASRRYLKAAERAANFIHEELYDKLGWTLKRVYREGPGDVTAFADDYAYMIAGLLDLYEATFNDRWLKLADQLQQTQLTIFWDTKHHAFFSTEPLAKDMLLQLKDGMDGAEPSTNGVSANNLYRLASLLADDEYINAAQATTSAFEPEAGQHPFLFPSLLGAAVAGRLGSRSYAIIGKGGKGSGGPELIKHINEQVRGWAGVKGTVVRLVGGTLAAGGNGLRRDFAKKDEDDEGTASGKLVRDTWVKERNTLLQKVDATRGDRVMVCEGKVCRMIGGDWELAGGDEDGKEGGEAGKLTGLAELLLEADREEEREKLRRG